MKENGSIIFEDGVISVEVTLEQGTVWLTQVQMSKLFDRDISVISRHIKNAINEYEISEKSNLQNMQIANSDKPVVFYDLDVVISVGYRVKSLKGTIFRRWATKILKEYTLKGVVYNEKRLKQLERMQEIQVDMMEGVKGFDASEVLSVLNLYSQGLQLLDDYDHRILLEKKNQETECIYQLSYEECIEVIEQSPFDARGDLFGKERDESFQSSINQIYQSYDGVELYPTLEDKAVNLLYFITKNHSFYDGNLC